MPKYKQNVSLVISKLMSPFSLLPYNLVQPSTLSTNTSKNYSKNLRGVPMSSSLLNCGMFSCSTILISRFFHFISKRSLVRSWSFSSVDGSMDFSQLQLAYLHYLELYLAFLHNYSLCESLIKLFEAK